MAYLILIGIAIFLYRKYTDHKLLNKVTNRYRGTKTERNLVVKMLKEKFDSRVVFHDLYIKKKKGGYTQIDMVIPTKVGILVFEVKDYKGWIFGNCDDRYWTQVLSYGQIKYPFYNPIKQNRGHIQALQYNLDDIGNVPYYSIIVFYGNCTLKEITNQPYSDEICYAGQVKKTVRYILSTMPKANYTNKQKVMDVLQTGVRNGANADIVNEHLSQF